ncbi:hypothetical protein CsatB_016187 [Cannabis sativa]
MDFSTNDEENDPDLFDKLMTFVSKMVKARNSRLGRLENYLLVVLTYIIMCWGLTFLLVTMVIKAFNNGGLELSHQVIFAVLFIISATLFFVSGLFLLVDEFYNKVKDWVIEKNINKYHNNLDIV